MRTYNLTGGTLIVPDELVFAFNPNFVQVSGISDNSEVTIDIWGDTGEQYEVVSTIRMAAYKGKASVDISAYLRDRFAGTTKHTEIFKTSTQMDISVSIDGVQKIRGIGFTVIYGAMFAGEVFNPSRTVKMWGAYPQVVSFFHPLLSTEGATVYVQKDNALPVEWNTSDKTAGIANYDNQQELEPMKESGQIVIYPAPDTSVATFTMQFDGTFTGVEGETIINIDIDNRPQCEDHIFLRWLDKWGFWQYWLCKIGSVEVSDAVVGSALTFLAGTTYPYYATRNIGKSMVRQITACATNLTEEEWKMLCTIKGSINVCAFDLASQAWVPVNVSASTSTWKKNDQIRQDFPLKVVFPTIKTQRL